jgi:hypothetical protein
MSVCTNCGPDRPSPLAGYAGYVLLRVPLSPHNLCPLSQCVFVSIGGPNGPAVWPPMLYMCICCPHIYSRSERINASLRSPTPITFTHCPNECLYQLGPRSARPFGRLCWICNAACLFCASSSRIYAHSRSPTPLSSSHSSNDCLCQC